MQMPPADDSELDADAMRVLRVLRHDYRKMTAFDVAHTPTLMLASQERAQAALDTLEAAGFVKRHTHRAGTAEHPGAIRYSVTLLGRAAAAHRK